MIQVFVIFSSLGISTGLSNFVFSVFCFYLANTIFLMNYYCNCWMPFVAKTQRQHFSYTLSVVSQACRKYPVILPLFTDLENLLMFCIIIWGILTDRWLHIPLNLVDKVQSSCYWISGFQKSIQGENSIFLHFIFFPTKYTLHLLVKLFAGDMSFLVWSYVSVFQCANTLFIVFMSSFLEENPPTFVYIIS